MTAVAVATAQCMMVSGVCLCNSARVFTTRNISRQTQLSNETATTVHVQMDGGYVQHDNAQESVPLAVIRTTEHLTDFNFLSWEDVNTF